MQNYKPYYRHYLVCFMLLFFVCCHNQKKDSDPDTVTAPESMDKRVSANISEVLEKALENTGKIDDHTVITSPRIVAALYGNIDYRPVWSSAEKWMPLADTLFQFISGAETEGLFPGDYHFKLLKILKDSLDSDSLTRMNASIWTKADILLTDGLVRIVKDLKQGRLQPDSITLSRDSVLKDDFFIAVLDTLLRKKDFTGLLTSLQPKHKKYWELKNCLKSFVDSMDRREFTHVKFPFRRGDKKDSLLFISTLQKRLLESNCIDAGKVLADSARLMNAIRKYQLKKGLVADGKYGNNLISSLNNTDVERFKRIAITLDKYKLLPEMLPQKYVWVNIPAYYLALMDADTVVFDSKVIVGKPETRTPLLNSKISDIITYPTWTVPNSIIVKQYLPKLKNNPNYISKIGLKLLNNKGEVVDPNTVNWSKYSRGIPYKIMQGSGDNNSLGVIKFNFNNPYAVYLHDTNQRYLFKNAVRAMSHGCVRVQEWEKLAYFIAGNDSTLSVRKDSLKYTADSIKSWIAKKERHQINVKNNIPLYIRYFSCEGKNGAVIFYNDVYGEDRLLIEKYFAKK